MIACKIGEKIKILKGIKRKIFKRQMITPKK
jgi:hypothetical protein